MGAKEFAFTALAIAVGVVGAGLISTYLLPKIGVGGGQ